MCSYAWTVLIDVIDFCFPGFNFAFQGISEEQTQQNMIVLFCLQEAVKADIFCGFYGARYGSSLMCEWHREWLKPNIERAEADFPWITDPEFENCSVTHMEFLEGSLRREGACPCVLPMIMSPSMN